MEILVGETAGFCYGVKRAVDGAKEQVEKEKGVYCLGEIVHNKQVVESLEKQGMQTVEDLEHVKNKVIIRAHGVKKEIYQEAKEKEIEVIDYTCPFVLKIQKIAAKYRDDGYFIVLFGKPSHPENIATVSHCGDNYFVIEKEEEIQEAVKAIEKSKMKKVYIIAQTTYSVDRFEKYEEILRNELNKKIEVVTNNTICDATGVRQRDTKKIAKQVDYMIIVGGKKSSNTRKLYDIAKQYCKEAISIETKEDLEEEDLHGYEKIGIMAGASTPNQSIEDVVKYLEEYDLVKV